MKLPNFLHFLKKNRTSSKTGEFSDFFLNASEDKKRQVFTEVAKEVNEEQRKVFERAKLHPRTR